METSRRARVLIAINSGSDTDGTSVVIHGCTRRVQLHNVLAKLVYCDRQRCFCHNVGPSVTKAPRVFFNVLLGIYKGHMKRHAKRRQNAEARIPASKPYIATE